jgi:hypothetical protein
MIVVYEKVEEVGADEVDVVRVQASGEAGEERADGEHDHRVAVGADADRLAERLVLAQRREAPAERRFRDTRQHEDRQRGDRNAT